MVRGRKTNLVVCLTPEQRDILESWQRSITIPAGLARRGRIILPHISHMAKKLSQ